MRVACCQVALDVEHPDAGWMRALTAARQAAGAGAQVVVLPELATSGYVFTSVDEARRAADRAEERLADVRALTSETGIVLVTGWCERESERLFNAALVVDRGEVRGVYRKAHLWADEPDWFTPGEAGPLVVDTSAGRIGVGICYDIEFPEWVRLAASQNVDLITAPVNWPLYTEPPAGERPTEIIKAQAFAATYRVPIAIADRCGGERGVEWIGGSCLVGADGYLLTSVPSGPAEPRTVSADVDVSQATRVIGPRNHALEDRRPQLYGESPRG